MSAQIDVPKFERILVNLLSNACKFTPNGGSVKCTLLHGEVGFAHVEVSDSGPGIAEVYRNSVFDQFFQIPGSARFGGTGLGLSIVKDFVEIQRGSIGIAQSAEGGACFSVDIPITAPSGAVVNRREDSVSAHRLASNGRQSLRFASQQPVASTQANSEHRVGQQGVRRILVVEDNPDMRAHICEALGGAFDITTAADGREGLEKARLIRPDLIVTDIMMPEMDGDEMFRMLRSAEECKATPVILLTAKADDSLRADLLNAGAIDYITKPFAAQELRAKVMNLLELRENEIEYLALLETTRVDVSVVVKASQAVSREIEYVKLVETLLGIAVEHAGADRGLLVLMRGAELWTEAEAKMVGHRVNVTLPTVPTENSGLARRVLERAIQTSTRVHFDASFPGDLGEHMGERSVGSVLCLPLLKQAKPIGAMYFENRSTRGAFTPERIAVLEVVASQAAISFENALLYADLQSENNERKRVEQSLRVREARMRRLGDSNVIGMFFADTNGRITETNDAFLDMTGYSREDLMSGRVKWSDMTPPEYSEADVRAVNELLRTGIFRAYEKEYVRKDGARVPVLLGGALLEGSQESGVAFVLDMTDRKRAEAEIAARRVAAKQAEEQVQALQTELAHASRVITLGQLSTSIAHEVAQPLGAIIMDGEACLRWLVRPTPQLDEGVLCVTRMIAAGKRAAGIIQHIRAFARRSAPQKTALEFDELVSEIVPILKAEASAHQVALEVKLDSGLPALLGDRIQLQQVILNLVVNGMQAMSGIDPASRRLVLRSVDDGSTNVVLSVEDSGSGFDPAHGNRLFERFFTTKADGMGMGLSICQSIIERHGGTIRAFNNARRGATFEVTLPIIERPSQR